MKFDGEFGQPFEGTVTDFVQWELGYSRQDPEIYQTRWKKIRDRLLDLLGSKQPLTISAGKHSYRLPQNDATGWREAFDRCG